MTEKADLLLVIESIRADKYPELPENIIEDIVSVSGNFMDDPKEAYKRISNIIDNFIDDNKGE